MPLSIIDLVPQYLRFADRTEGLNQYIATYPRFFDHYHIYWGKPELIQSSLTETEVRSRGKKLRGYLTEAEVKFEKWGFKFDNIAALIFIGQGKANGHAFLDETKAIAWYALETYSTERQLAVFVTHELIHAFHYSVDPKAYFCDSEQQNLFSRQLITEGIATYLTKQLHSLSDKESLWADRLSPEKLDKWMEICEGEKQRLYEYSLKHFRSSDPTIRFFHASDSKDIYQNRAGYYIGLKVIEQLVKEESLSPIELIHKPMNTLIELTYEILQKGSKSRL